MIAIAALAAHHDCLTKLQSSVVYFSYNLQRASTRTHASYSAGSNSGPFSRFITADDDSTTATSTNCSTRTDVPSRPHRLAIHSLLLITSAVTGRTCCNKAACTFPLGFAVASERTFCFKPLKVRVLTNKMHNVLQLQFHTYVSMQLKSKKGDDDPLPALILTTSYTSPEWVKKNPPKNITCLN